MNTFYSALLNPEEKCISLAGGGGKSVLIHKISQECALQHKMAAIMSLYPLYVPLDSKTIISDDINLINQQITREAKQYDPIYIGSSFTDQRVEAFKLRLIKELLSNLSADHIFIKTDQTHGKPISGLDNLNLSVTRQTDRLIFVIGADAFNQEKQDKYMITTDSYWQDRSVLDPVDIAGWYLNHEMFRTLLQKKMPVTVFVNMVENIFHENLAIAFARQMKLGGIDRVVYGSVFNSEFHIIK